MIIKIDLRNDTGEVKDDLIVFLEKNGYDYDNTSPDELDVCGICGETRHKKRMSPNNPHHCIDCDPDA